MADSVNIGNIQISPATFLAPIAEITDITFRKIVRNFGGVGAVFTEMISSEAYTRDNERTDYLIRYSKEEYPLFFQIVGTDPERMAESAKKLEAHGADAVDINMGCPSSNVTKNGSGAALLRNLDLAEKIIKKVRKAVSIPFTVKIRSGWDDHTLVYKEIGKIAEDNGADALFFHGRTRKQMFGGNVNYNQIRELKQMLSIPVIGNGDVTDRDSYEKMMETGVDGVMIARAAIKKPWVFSEIINQKRVDPAVLRELIFRQFGELMDIYPERLAMHKMKSFLGWYSRSLEKGKVIRLQLNQIFSTVEILDILEKYFIENER